MPPDVIRGWIPVRVKKTRQIKNLERTGAPGPEYRVYRPKIKISNLLKWFQPGFVPPSISLTTRAA
jgi:hypothetical protein